VEDGAPEVNVRPPESAQFGGAQAGEDGGQ